MFWIILFFMVGFLYAAFQAKIKGIIGEKIVAMMLSGLPDKQYKVLNDIMLETEQGTTQIDHIVISVYGIFVIETKNYKGWITGSEYGDYWTKNMYGKKYKFRNPLKQNYAHVKALEEKLGLKEEKFIPIVAFSGNSNIKVKSKAKVVYIGQLKRVIKSYGEILFTESDLDRMVEKILICNITDKEIRRRHVEQIKAKVAGISDKKELGVCPNCGGKLTEVKISRGQFLRCSNFPNCNYTKH